MRSSGTFYSKSGTNAVSEIPVLSPEKMKSQLSDANITGRIGYLYSHQRAQPHINAQEVLQTLYHLGAELINNGKAYSRNVKISSFDSVDMEKTKSAALSQSEMERRASLLEEYNGLPKSKVKNGRNEAMNPLHALFVIRVGLDHMTLQSIYLMFTALRISSTTMTMIPNEIQFPNGSGFLGDYAALQVLRGYISNNIDRFNFLTDQDVEIVNNDTNPFTASYMSITNDDDKRVDDILSQPILEPAKRLTK